MKDRGMKKWRPFNAVVSGEYLLSKPRDDEFPTLSPDEIERFEEILKSSMYTHSKIKISFIENASRKSIEDYVLALDPIKKDVTLASRKINFRQIYDIKK